MTSSNKVLITGVAGLIGSHFSRYLLDKGYQVYGIDDLSGGYQEYVDPRVKFYCYGLNDRFNIENVFFLPGNIPNLARLLTNSLEEINNLSCL